MRVRCPDCGSIGVLSGELAGQMARCSRCGGKFVAKEEISSGESVKWYYAEGDQKKGPFSEEKFALLIDAGTVASQTLVWRKGMEAWQTLASTREEQTVFLPHEEGVARKGGAAEPRSPGETEDTGAVATPAPWTAGLRYAGGGRRLLAKGIDLIFMAAMASIVEGVSRRLFPADPGAGIDKVYIVTMLVSMLFGMFYIVWFVGKFGATPGKMVFSVKVVTPAGGRVDYMHAFGRYWSEFVVIWLTFGIGYLPIIFDAQKRGLHDRLCSTRVVRV